MPSAHCPRSWVGGRVSAGSQFPKSPASQGSPFCCGCSFTLFLPSTPPLLAEHCTGQRKPTFPPKRETSREILPDLSLRLLISKWKACKHETPPFFPLAFRFLTFYFAIVPCHFLVPYLGPLHSFTYIWRATGHLCYIKVTFPSCTSELPAWGTC